MVKVSHAGNDPCSVPTKKHYQSRSYLHSIPTLVLLYHMVKAHDLQ